MGISGRRDCGWRRSRRNRVCRGSGAGGDGWRRHAAAAARRRVVCSIASRTRASARRRAVVQLRRELDDRRSGRIDGARLSRARDAPTRSPDDRRRARIGHRRIELRDHSLRFVANLRRFGVRAHREPEPRSRTWRRRDSCALRGWRPRARVDSGQSHRPPAMPVPRAIRSPHSSAWSGDGVAESGCATAHIRRRPPSSVRWRRRAIQQRLDREAGSGRHRAATALR